MAKLGVALTTGRTGQPAGPSSMAVDGPAAATAAANGTDAAGLVSGAGTEVQDGDEGTWVEPQRFKSLVGRGHAEFSTNRQQVIVVGINEHAAGAACIICSGVSQGKPEAAQRGAARAALSCPCISLTPGVSMTEASSLQVALLYLWKGTPFGSSCCALFNVWGPPITKWPHAWGSR